MGGWEVSRNVDSVDACPKREEDGLTSFSIPVRNDWIAFFSCFAHFGRRLCSSSPPTGSPRSTGCPSDADWPGGWYELP
jgi:hypothetical protein